MPMVRTILPPIEFCWWPNTCSTAPTADDFVRRAGGYGSASPSSQARLNLHRAVGAVRPDPLAGIGEIEHIVQLPNVQHNSDVADCRAATWGGALGIDNTSPEGPQPIGGGAD